MPLLWIKNVEKKEDIWVACWKIDIEELANLEEKVVLYSEEKLQLENIKLLQRKIEFLSARAALQAICKIQHIDYQGIFKDDRNKPFLLNHSANISISHCKEYAMAILSPKNKVGIDIEKVTPKIQKVASKVFSENELNFLQNDTEKSVALWATKEALYKLYGKKNIQLNKQIVLDSSTKKIINNNFLMQLKLPFFEKNYPAKVSSLENHLWSYVFDETN